MSLSHVTRLYLAVQARLNKPLEEVKPQILQQLKQAKLQQARENYLAQLRQQAKVAIYLSPPRVKVGYDPARVKGNPNAPVTIVEFADFQCPFCGRIEPTLNELLNKYDGKVRLAYRDFPLSPIHPYAQKAAEASRCAGEQGKFGDYHDLLFANQAKLDNPSLLQYARSLKLDEKKFEDCLSSGQYAAAVAKDLEEGKQAGISGTPAFFINGIALSGAVPPQSFTALIDDELTRTMSAASDGEHAAGHPH
jgi:protein-disulfide isomerase